MNRFPKVPLELICEKITDGTHHSPPNGPSGDFMYVTAKNIKPWGLDLDDITYVDAATHAEIYARCDVRKDDVLYVKDGAGTGGVALNTVEEPFSLLSSVGVLRPGPALLPKYLLFALQEPATKRAMLDNVAGVAITRLTLRKLSAAEIPVAPLAEQARIVAKLEELLSDLDAGVAELKAAQKKLQQYRQSLLKAAVEGALTADWREAQRQQGTPTETGAQLLARILTERRARWEARQLAKFKEQGKAPPKDWQKKYPEPMQPDTSDLRELPAGWVWASLDQLVAESSYGTSVKCSYESNGTPVLRIPNVSAGKIDLGDMKFSVEQLELEAEDYLAVGDVLIIRTNGSIGLVGRAAAVVEDLPRQHYFASYLLRLRVVERTIVHRWILTALSAQTGRQWLERRAASSAGQHNISLSTLLSMPVPLAGLQEQSAALNQLEAGHRLIDEQEQTVTRSVLRTSAQRQNILRAAFAGALVSQNSNDEPASALLGRIRAARADHLTQTKVRKTRRFAGA